MMTKKIFSLVVVIVGLTLIHSVTLAAAPFYEGKTIRVIVGFTAGGGFDTYARAMARHMGKHIPGHPAIIVDNMPGAGSLISANTLYKAIKPDGLTIAHFMGNLFFNQACEQPGIEFDALKFSYLGTVFRENITFILTKASGITSIDKWIASKTPVKMGGTGPGSGPDNAIRLLKAALGLPIQLITGYPGLAEVRLAMESGEVAGGTWGWDSAKVTLTKGLETGDFVVVLQAVPKPLSDLPNVPLVINFAKTDEARQLIEVGIHGAALITRVYAMPPGAPKDRVEILRNAFQETLKDKEFLEEAKKSKMTVDPVIGGEVEEAVFRILKLNPSLLAKLKNILFK